ncbi:hypothetical protein AVEN_254092-1 [Araneus ventricosus]|uniref:Uncharacterized protein n=1 Tax=Araneus ventricosus TaxID=182803 RepID=A0A4Y2BYQ2_ARAVE|nr:hypothetical protein AVEN_254092-1 [Araneus ventricosus]
MSESAAITINDSELSEESSKSFSRPDLSFLKAPPHQKLNYQGSPFYGNRVHFSPDNIKAPIITSNKAGTKFVLATYGPKSSCSNIASIARGSLMLPLTSNCE